MATGLANCIDCGPLFTSDVTTHIPGTAVVHDRAMKEGWMSTSLEVRMRAMPAREHGSPLEQPMTRSLEQFPNLLKVPSTGVRLQVSLTGARLRNLATVIQTHWHCQKVGRTMAQQPYKKAIILDTVAVQGHPKPSNPETLNPKTSA